MPRGRQRSNGEPSSTEIKFTGGGSVKMTFHGNLFDLTEKERELIADLSDVIQQFNHAPAETAVEAKP